MANYFVVKRENLWGVKRGGASKLSAIVNTQRVAEKIAKEYCKNAGGGEVRIQGRDGKFRDSDTVKPGNDPCPPKDQKF